MKKWLIVIGLLISVVGIACAEELSRTYVALLQSNGHWEYLSVKDTDNEAWVKISNPKTGETHKQNWDINQTKSGKVDLKVSDWKDECREIHSFSSNLLETKEYTLVSNYGNYAVNCNFVMVWHRNSFSGIGFIFDFLMPNEADDTFERNCVESFLNEWKDAILKA